MIIEKMNICDIEEISLIEEEIFKEPWPKSFFLEELDNDFASYYVLKENDEIVGYAGFWQMFENCDLNTIGIKTKFQGQGYGEKLLRYLISEAIKKECEFMHLEVRVSNIKAQSLYKKYGFIETRIREHYYADGEDCIDMVKGLIGLSEEDFSD